MEPDKLNELIIELLDPTMSDARRAEIIQFAMKHMQDNVKLAKQLTELQEQLSIDHEK